MPITLLTPWPGIVSGAAVLAAAISIAAHGQTWWSKFRPENQRLRYADDPDARPAGLLNLHPSPRRSTVLVFIGATFLAAAATSPAWTNTGVDRVTVMVDLSPSTRGADYRDRHRLTARIAELLCDTPVDLVAFAGTNAPLPASDMLPDTPCERTTFDPPPGQPVLLFSDGQFDLPPNTPPVFAVIDPQLISPTDSAVASLKVVGHTATAVVRHNGPPRQATWYGTADIKPATVNEKIVLSSEAAERSAVCLTLNAGDRWPENDTLTALAPPPEHRAAWWVGDRDPGPGWFHLLPSQLPSIAEAWLDPSVVLLDNVPASALDRLQQDALLRYARDFGGGVILLGGNRAFAAGAYGSTSLGAISPLADAPPVPAARWVILIDASGSMAAAGPNGSLFDGECAAARSLLQLIPPADRVQVSAFSRGPTEWIDAPAASAIDQPLPPPGTAPNGPTVLEPALRSAFSASSLPTRVLLMTDADTDSVDAGAMTKAAAAANAKLLLLALGHGAALSSLTDIARRTGGGVVEEPKPTDWASAAQALLRAQLPDHVEHRAVAVAFTGELSSLGIRHAEVWNHTWLKRSATLLATTDGVAPALPMAARWPVGTGSVTAVAFGLSPADARSVADRIAALPVDPRFTIRWDTRSARPQVTVTAIDAGRFLNQQLLRLDCNSADSVTAAAVVRAIPQVAPGKYAIDLPPSTSARVFRVRSADQTLDRRAIPGRFAAEFDAIGINFDTLSALADRSGGAVVRPGQTTRLHSRSFRSQRVLVSPLVAAALVCLAAGLWMWRRENGP